MLLCLVIAATPVVSFKDADKIKSWDAWHDHEAKAAITHVLQKEKPCIPWINLQEMKFGLPEIGRLRTRTSSEVKGSKWSINCAGEDRDYADWDAYKDLVPMLGVKRMRFLSGWAKTEQVKGVYDFAWLDHILRECNARSVKPWVCLCYGNPVYGSDFRLGMRVSQLIGDKEAFAAWLRYVKATVARYRDIVDEWEIWNEPFRQGEEYATLYMATARAVREVQPTAKVLCTSIIYPKDYTAVLERLKAENAYDLCDGFIYHPYSPNPDESYTIGEGQFCEQPPIKLLKLVKSYYPKDGIIQGECGCPSQLEYAHAMHDIEWTEYSQAKWDLRRAIGDAVRDIPSNMFSMIDLKYTYMLQSFGLVRSNLLKEFVYRRPSWYAMRNVFGLIDDDVKPISVETRGRLTTATFTRSGKPIYFVWFSDKQPGSELKMERIKLSLAIANPVWVEMITGRACSLGSLDSVPVWDSPVLIAETGAVPLVVSENGK